MTISGNTRDDVLIVPKASSYKRPERPDKRRNTNRGEAPAKVCVCQVSSEACKYTNQDGTCLFPNIDTVGNNVYLVALTHDKAFPAMDFKLTEYWDKMLREDEAADKHAPRSWAQLAECLHVIEVNTGTYVPYFLPYKQWQRAYYVAGSIQSCKNFLMALDTCITHRCLHQTNPKFGSFPLDVEIAKDLSLDLDVKEFDYQFTTIKTGVDVAQMTLTPLHVYPPDGVRPLICNLELVDDSGIAMTFFGDTYRHRGTFSDEGLEMEREASSYKEIEEGNSPSKANKRLETFHIMGTRDISDEEQAESVRKLLTTGIAHAIVDMRVIEQGTDADDSKAMMFLEQLKKYPNLIFREG